MRNFLGLIFKLLMFMAAILGAALVAIVCYFYFVPKNGPPTSTPQPTAALSGTSASSKPNPATTGTGTPQAGMTVLSGKFFLPELLKATWPPDAMIFPQLREVDGQGTHIFPNPDATVFDVTSKAFRFPALLKPNSTYVLYISVCSSRCTFSNFAYITRSVVETGAEPSKSINLGAIPIDYYYPRSPKPCEPNQPLFAGEVIPTKTFPSKPGPGRKYVFLVSNWRPTLNSGPGLYSAARDSAGRKYVGTPRSNVEIIHAVDLQMAPDGFHFSVPYPGFDPGPFTKFTVVECDQKLSPLECEKKIAIYPANVRTLPGAVYRLIPSALTAPRCGDKNIKLFLHSFGTNDSPFKIPHKTDPSFPEEIMEGSNAQ